MAEILGTAFIYRARLKYLRKVCPNYLNMASMCGKRLKYHRNCFTMLEMTEDFDKRLIYV